MRSMSGNYIHILSYWLGLLVNITWPGTNMTIESVILTWCNETENIFSDSRVAMYTCTHVDGLLTRLEDGLENTVYVNKCKTVHLMAVHFWSNVCTSMDKNQQKAFSHEQKKTDSLRRILRAGIVYLIIPRLTAFASFHTTQCNNSINVPRDECTDIAGYHWTIEFSVLIIASTSEMITFHLRAVRACVCDIRPRTIT